MRKLLGPVLLIAFSSIALPCTAQDSLPNSAAVRSYYQAGLHRNGIIGSSLALVGELDAATEVNVAAPV